MMGLETHSIRGRGPRLRPTRFAPPPGSAQDDLEPPNPKPLPLAWLVDLFGTRTVKSDVKETPRRAVIFEGWAIPPGRHTYQR